MLRQFLMYVATDAQGNGAFFFSDGTPAGTWELGEKSGLYPAFFPSGSPYFVSFNGKVLIDVPEVGADQLWVTNGTDAGTYRITGNFYLPPVVPINAIALGDDVLLRAKNSDGYWGLWVTDGTSVGTHELTVSNASQTGDHNPSTPGLYPTLLTAIGGKAFFLGWNAIHQSALWVTDGTSAGTHELTGVSGALFGTAQSTFTQDFAAVNGELLYAGEDPVDQTSHIPTSLWATDGTAAGTHEISGISGVPNGIVQPGGLTAVNGEEAMFTVPQLSGYEGLWITDGSAAGTHEITGIQGAPADGLAPRNFTEFLGKTLFEGADTNGHTYHGGIWITDGTAGGTVELVSGINASNFSVLGHLAYFTAPDAADPSTLDLWVTDGTGGGTREVNPVIQPNSLETVTLATSPHNFTSYFTSDVLLRNDAGGLADWAMNDTTVVHGNSLGSVPTNWTIAGTGDFNGDGISDLLWRNDAGNTAIWDMNNGAILHADSLGSIPANWHIAGTGDFNGDQMSDILWRNDAGGLAIWDMNDGAIVNANSLGAVPDNWKIAGTGDFNGDGKSDILWRSDAGAVAIWAMNDGTILHANSAGILPANWHIAGTGDFNGDHKTDILLNNDAGVVAVWDMNDSAIIGGGAVATLPSNWHISSTADYNGDGKSDILLRNDAGVVAIWDMNDTAIVGGGSLGVVPANWHIIV